MSDPSESVPAASDEDQKFISISADPQAHVSLIHASISDSSWYKPPSRPQSLRRRIARAAYGLLKAHFGLWRVAWNELQRARGFHWLRKAKGLLAFLAFTGFGLSLYQIIKSLFPALPRLAWVTIVLGVVIIVQEIAIHFLGRHLDRKVKESQEGETSARKQTLQANIEREQWEDRAVKARFDLHTSAARIAELEERLAAFERPTVFVTFMLDDLLDHVDLRLDNTQPLFLNNQGDSVFEVSIADIDFGNGRIANFPIIPFIGEGGGIEVRPTITEGGIPIFNAHDLANAIATAVYNQPHEGMVRYPLRVTYRDRTGRRFESLSEIEVFDPPVYLNVRTIFRETREIV
jgi:hypothetical protein